MTLKVISFIFLAIMSMAFFISLYIAKRKMFSKKTIKEECSIYKMAVEKWGIESQVFMAIEEMAELTQAISKRYRGKQNIENLREEIADVEIMMGQLRVMFDSDFSDIDRIKNEKLKRLENMVLSGI